MSEKSEKPTSKRLRESRQKGQIAKSVDVTSLCQLVTVAVVFMFMGNTWYAEIGLLINETITQSVSADFQRIQDVTIKWGIEIGSIIGMTGIAVLIITIISQIAQVGFVISGHAFKTGGSKFNVVANLKQMFSPKNLFDLVKSLVKIIVITAIFYFLLKSKFKSFQFASLCGSDCAMPLMSHMIYILFVGLVIASIFIAMADYAFQRRSIMKQLMMTKEEIKQEYKDSEGNQEIKSKRKEIHRELQHSAPRESVKKSSVVIKNPTHISICIEYDKDTCPVPRVLHKAVDKNAFLINKYAEQYGIPVVENIPLARGLFAKIKVGQYISKEFYEPVAEVLRLVMDLSYDDSEDE